MPSRRRPDLSSGRGDDDAHGLAGADVQHAYGIDMLGCIGARQHVRPLLAMGPGVSRVRSRACGGNLKGRAGRWRMSSPASECPAAVLPVATRLLHHPAHELGKRQPGVRRQLRNQRGRGHARLRIDFQADQLARAARRVVVAEVRPRNARGSPMLYEPSTLTSAPIRKHLMKAGPAAGGASRRARTWPHSCRSAATPPGRSR